MKKQAAVIAIQQSKMPPQAKTLEGAVLGALLIDAKVLPEVLDIIFAEVFFQEPHQKIFAAIADMYDRNQRIDMLTLAERLSKVGELEIVGGVAYIAGLTNSVVSSANIEAHCRILLEKYMQRDMIRISSEAMQRSYADDTDVFDVYDKTEADILQTQERVLRGGVKDMNYFSAKVYDQYETTKSVGALGIKTGIVPFDSVFSGLVSPDLFVIAARPAQGKTSFALSISHHISVVNNIPGAWFSFEMDGIQLARRLAVIDAEISHEYVRQGRLQKDYEQRFYNSIDRIAKSPIIIEDKTSQNIRNIRTRTNVLKRKHKIQYIVVDYLQLMEGVQERNVTNRENEIAKISRGLKGLAKELEMPVIALSQLSRKVEERSDKIPQLSDLRESGAIEQDADEVMFLMRPEYYGMTEQVTIGDVEYSTKGLCIGVSAKNRHGATRNFAMSFNAPCMKFTTHSIDGGNIPYPKAENFRNFYEPIKDENPF